MWVNVWLFQFIPLQPIDNQRFAKPVKDVGFLYENSRRQENAKSIITPPVWLRCQYPSLWHQKYSTVFLPTFCVYLQILLMDLGVTAFTVSLLLTNKNLIPETSIWYWQGVTNRYPHLVLFENLYPDSGQWFVFMKNLRVKQVPVPVFPELITISDPMITQRAKWASM